MTVFEKIKSMTKEEIVNWISELYNVGDSSPWIKWWDDNYCKKCESVMLYDEWLKRDAEFAWCEVNNGDCKFFPEKEMASYKTMIEAWLDSEDTNIFYGEET